MIDKVFLDMDGVLTDFTGAASRFLGLPSSNEDYTSWDAILKYYKGTTDQFWREFPECFWSDYIGWMPDGKRIWEVVKKYNPIILTSPGLYSGGQGKIDWLRVNLPEVFYDNRYLIGPGKYHVARRGAVLIDDADFNIDEWVANGGYGILVPRNWNSAIPAMSADIPGLIARALRYFEFVDVRKQATV